MLCTKTDSRSSLSLFHVTPLQGGLVMRMLNGGYETLRERKTRPRSSLRDRGRSWRANDDEERTTMMDSTRTVPPRAWLRDNRAAGVLGVTDEKPRHSEKLDLFKHLGIDRGVRLMPPGRHCLVGVLEGIL